MKLINEEDDVRVFLQFVQNSLHPLFKLSAVLCACYQRGQVEGYDTFAEKGTRYLTLDNTAGKAFSYSRLTNTGFADQYGVILFPAAEDLCNTFQFILSSHNGIETAFLGCTCNITSEIVEDGCFGFRVGNFLYVSAECTSFIHFIFGCIFRKFIYGLYAGYVFITGGDGLQFIFYHAVLNAILFKSTANDIVFIFEDGEQQVFRPDQVTFEHFSFKVCDLKGTFCLLH